MNVSISVRNVSSLFSVVDGGSASSRGNYARNEIIVNKLVVILSRDFAVYRR